MSTMRIEIRPGGPHGYGTGSRTFYAGKVYEVSEAEAVALLATGHFRTFTPVVPATADAVATMQEAMRAQADEIASLKALVSGLSAAVSAPAPASVDPASVGAADASDDFDAVGDPVPAPDPAAGGESSPNARRGVRPSRRTLAEVVD